MLAREIPQFFEGARDCLESLAQDRADMLAREMPRFFEGVRVRLEILTQCRVEVEAHLARRFNFFYSIDFFDSIPSKNKREDRMSNVFAYLLNPDETHGQGELFLRKFLSAVPVEWSESGWAGVRIGREVTTTRIENWRRKIDIEIAFRTDDGWEAIAIENKPWADDQDLQLSDYARHLKSKYKKRFKLIYLTPDGKKPSETSITLKKREKLEENRQLVYASIRKWAGDNGWLKRAEEEVKAERVRWFVSDFRNALIETL